MRGGGLMGFARACSVALVGVEGVVVEVQADLEAGVAAFTLVGLPDKSLVESRDRVRAAVANSGAEWPQKKLTVGLSPASVPKGGSGFDLAVACAVLGAAERIDPASIADVVMIGELGLDGRVRPVRGVLPAVLAAAEAGYRQVVVPEQTAGEAALVPGVSVLGVRSLRQLIAVLCDEPVPDERQAHDEGRPDTMLAGLMVPGAGIGTGLARGAGQGDGHLPDLADVAGQERPRMALEVAAAGGHHLLLSGPPGAGKTMLAERLPAILPELTRKESLEVTAVHSVAGILPPGSPWSAAALLRTPPLGDDAVADRRGQRTAEARCGLAGSSGNSFSGRGARILRAGAGRAAPAAGIGACGGGTERRSGAAARQISDGAGGQPVPVRPAQPQRRRLRMPAVRGQALPGETLRAAARPGGSAGARRPGQA